jgi:hypothetical protein
MSIPAQGNVNSSTGKCQFQHREIKIPAQGNANSSTGKRQFQHNEMPIQHLLLAYRNASFNTCKFYFSTWK